MDSNIVLQREVVALTDVGCRRSNNEDSFGYDPDAGLFVVCDGMGGMAAGETASASAVNALLQHFVQLAPSVNGTNRLIESILCANRDVYKLAQTSKSLNGMGTTMVTALIEGSRAIIGNVGDSRAYFLRDDLCRQITEDHSFVAEQMRLGSMNAEEAGSSPYQSLITRAVGTAESVEPDIFTVDLEPDDILLLTTDGLTRYADAGSIARQIRAGRNLHGACENLILTAKDQGALDNVTCMLVRFYKESDDGGGE